MKYTAAKSDGHHNNLSGAEPEFMAEELKYELYSNAARHELSA